MYKPTFKELVGILVTGVGTVLALAFTDFGLSGAALAGVFTMLAVLLETRRAARGCRKGAS